MNKLQKDLIVISDSKVIKVYKKPITKKILNSFSEIPKSATEISKTISFPKEKIYYHIKNLLKHDLLIIASANVVKGIDLIEWISEQPTNENDVPVSDIIVEDCGRL